MSKENLSENKVKQTRPETGAMRFDDDWTGVFIRGDNAMYYAMQLSRFLDELKKNQTAVNIDVFENLALGGLLKTLQSCMHGPGYTPESQKMKKFEECARDIDDQV